MDLDNFMVVFHGILGHIYHLRYQWIGLRENFNRKAPYLMGKSMVSG